MVRSRLHIFQLLHAGQYGHIHTTVNTTHCFVHRVWKSVGLKPYLIKTFKASNDPQFEEKLHDVVGLYLDPPQSAVVLSIDEKTSIQALDRTQPGLPLKKARCSTMTHDQSAMAPVRFFRKRPAATSGQYR